ncbi:MAG: DUF488 domain-containing protein [Anaerolineales bacterium]|nr:DUF488 domain-containing protein [Anaerolineales bacterium]
MLKIVTIGVYGFTAETFFETLQTAGVQFFCDVRWRRGVRGAAYAFANHKRLQARLESLGIAYHHRRDLAPTPEIRQRQSDADRRGRVAKRKRASLSAEFVSAYQAEILSDFDPHEFIAALPEGARVVALFCVEREPAACHRSLLAEKLHRVEGIEVEHLQPRS